MVRLEGGAAVAAVRDNNVVELETRGLVPWKMRNLVKFLGTNTTMLTLKFGDNRIGVEGTKAMANALKMNTTLTSLDLDVNNIGVDGAAAMADALKTNTTLMSLNLTSNAIGAEGAKAVADALKVNTTLMSLDLCNNYIGVEGAKAMADALKVNTTLTSLGLSGNVIGDEGAEAVADSLKMNMALTSLDLGNNEIGDEGAKAMADALKVNTTLTSLNHLNNGIRNKGVEAVADALKVNMALTSLDLGSSDISAEGAVAMADALKVNTTLTLLNLGNNEIGDEGAKAMADALKVNTTLTSLNLGASDIGAEGAEAIADALKVNTTLTSLDFEYSTNLVDTWKEQGCNHIGAEGAKAMADALKMNKALASLNLQWNVIGDEGAEAMADALKMNTTLTSLKLGGSSIGDEGAKAVAEALIVNTTLTSLDIGYNYIGAVGAVAVVDALKTNTTLTSLNLDENDIGTDGAAAMACAFVLQRKESQCLSLRELSVDVSSALPANGPLAAIPLELLEENQFYVRQYLLSLKPGDVEARRRLKVLVVGYAGAGKTTLLDVLSPFSSHAFVITKTLISTKAVPCTVTLRSSLLSVTGQINQTIHLDKDHWTMTLQRGDHGPSLAFLPSTSTVGIPLILTFSSPAALAELKKRAEHVLYNRPTHGIDVRPLALADQSDVELTAWDFAGQRDYYDQHHYFLDDRAIYVLCLDIRKHIKAAEEALLFWMRLLKTRLAQHADARASLVVVGTHADTAVSSDRAARINEIAGELQLPVSGYFEVSNLPPFVGIAALTKHLTAEASRLTSVRETIPGEWRLVELAIDVLAREHSTFPMVDLATVQARVKVLSKTDIAIDVVRTCLVNMSTWGRIVYLTLTEHLANIVVLSPTFLTQECLGMLFSPAVLGGYMKNGRLSLSDLDHVWKDHQVVKYRNGLLELLHCFDVCFPLREDGIDRLVFPGLISGDEPSDLTKTWPAMKSPEEDEMARFFAFDVLPPELVSRLLSRIGQDVHGKLLWRYGAGICGKNNTTLGLLRADATPNATTGRLHIRVRSAQSGHRDALTVLARLVHETHECIKLYKGVTITEELLCGCDHGNGLTPLELVVDALATGQRDMRCAHNNLYPMRKLLEGAGLIEPSAFDKPIIAGGLNDDLVRMLVARLDILEPALRAVIVGVDCCNYPALFMLVPAANPSTWLNKLVDRVKRTRFDKLQLHALCEFHLGDERPLCHVPRSSEALEIKDLRNRGMIKRLDMALKITSYALKSVQIDVKIAGIPLPDIACALSGLVDMVCQSNDGTGVLRQEPDNNTHVRVHRRDRKPQRLQGKALGDVEALFGRNLNGFVESAGLHRVSVLRDGCPTGTAGTCLWICADHRHLVEQWNSDTQMDADAYERRGQEITETQWVMFGDRK